MNSRFLAAVFAALWPVQQWLTRQLRGRSGVAAGLLTASVVLVLLGPVAMMVTFIPAGRLARVREGAIDRMPHDLGEIMGQTPS